MEICFISFDSCGIIPKLKDRIYEICFGKKLKAFKMSPSSVVFINKKTKDDRDKILSDESGSRWIKKTNIEIKNNGFNQVINKEIFLFKNIYNTIIKNNIMFRYRASL